MNPWRLFLRGWVLALSNPQLPALLACSYLVFTVLALAPPAACLPTLLHSLREVLPPGAPPLDIMAGLWLLGRDHWPAAVAAWVLLTAWWTLLTVGYFYVVAGVVALLVEGRRVLPVSRGLASRGGRPFEKARVFTWRLFREGAAASWWRVTLLAGAYALAASLGLLVLTSAAVAYSFLAVIHRWTIPFDIAGFLLLSMLLALALWGMVAHYRCALVFTVEKGRRAGEAAGEATALILRHPLALLGMVLLWMAVAGVEGAVFGMLSTPASLLATVETLKGAAWVLRAGVLLIHIGVHGLIQVGAMGSYVSYCAGASEAAPRSFACESGEA